MTNFIFIHATDLHIAQRNDFILKFLKDKVRDNVNQFVNQFVLTRDFEFKENIQEDRLNDLHYAKYNFNYNLRKLIDYINEKVKKMN